MKYLWLSALLFSHAVLARCPDEDQRVTLQGTLIQQTLPGPPNYESIKDGDEAVTYDYLKLINRLSAMLLVSVKVFR